MSTAFLCDENVPEPVVAALAAQGLDVRWMAMLAPGTPDPAVLAMAEQDGRVLVTLDKDFGELTTKRASSRSGIILLRLPLRPLAAAAAQIAALIAGRHDWTGHLAVIEPGRVRMRPLGKAP